MNIRSGPKNQTRLLGRLSRSWACVAWISTEPGLSLRKPNKLVRIFEEKCSRYRRLPRKVYNSKSYLKILSKSKLQSLKTRRNSWRMTWRQLLSKWKKRIESLAILKISSKIWRMNNLYLSSKTRISWKANNSSFSTSLMILSVASSNSQINYLRARSLSMKWNYR